MLLVIDVGNTNMKLGVYDGDVLKKSWRLSTEAKRTADELGMILYDLFKNVGVEFQDIDGIIMSSVAPMLNYDSKKNFFDTSHVEEVIELVLKVNPKAVMEIGRAHV